jgi:hypothetical protein
VLLPGRRTVTVTKEERHQAALARHLAPDRSSREVIAELDFCVIGEGKYRGSRAIEVALGGERVGELTLRMSERYAPLVDAVLARGGRPMCTAGACHANRVSRG